MKQRGLTKKWIYTLCVTAFGVLFLLPLLWMISSSLKAGPEVFSSNFSFFPAKAQWENYARVWTHEEIPFWRVYCNSLFVAVVGTVGLLLVSSLAGYSLAKIVFRGKNIVFLSMLVTMMIPGQAAIIPRFVLFEAIGLYNTLWALVLPGFFSITSIFLLRQFYIGLPNELAEAARVDGAGHLQIWWRVLTPLTKPALVTVTVLSFISSWNEYMDALIFLPSSRNFTISQGIQYWMQMTDEYNLMMAAASSAVIPVIILFVFAQKYFVESIATAGVKG